VCLGDWPLQYIQHPAITLAHNIKLRLETHEQPSPELPPTAVVPDGDGRWLHQPEMVANTQAHPPHKGYSSCGRSTRFATYK